MKERAHTIKKKRDTRLGSKGDCIELGFADKTEDIGLAIACVLPCSLPLSLYTDERDEKAVCIIKSKVYSNIMVLLTHGRTN